MMPSTAFSRSLTIFTRCMQYASAAIVVGITSYFINNFRNTEHTVYQEVIVRPHVHHPPRSILTSAQSTISLAFFLPAFVSPFMPNKLTKYVTPIDFIFSYL